MIKDPSKSAKNKAPVAASVPFRWRCFGGYYLVTNDFGAHVWVGAPAFALLVSGKITGAVKEYKSLQAGGFIGNMLDFEAMAARLRGRNSHLSCGPGLHILSLTDRCNHKCLYCQSGALGLAAKGRDMSWNVARRSVDFAFSTTAPALTIEFQGGEPMLNWDVLCKIITYARKKERSSGKKLTLSLVSNFSLMTEARAQMLLENEVSVCTSLDGPAAVHKANRPFSGGNSHGLVTKWLAYFSGKSRSRALGGRVFKPGALLTVTRRSLGSHREIIDEYVKQGLEDIFIRPLSPIGYAKKAWGTIGYTPAEFAAFYSKSLDYILGLNRRGVVLREKTAVILLEKILGPVDPGYMDLRCPCGAATGQIAYSAGGDIYTCDEGRMLGTGGEDLFRMGSVLKDTYARAIASPAARACAAASELHAQPECSRCAYGPYCGVCPVYNYSAQGSLWGSMPSNDRCAIMKAVLDAVFLKLRKPGDRKVMETWIKK